MTNFKIFQVKKDLTRNFGYMGFDMMKSLGIEIDLNNYDMVYEGKIKTDLDDKSQGLEHLFYMFNMENIQDFYGRSMSVSDIVKIDDEYYYCDSFGWKQIFN